MKKINIGVVEGFFGPQWEAEKRKSYAQFLAAYGGEFYIYAPKEDAHLRKGWRGHWDQNFIDKIFNLKKEFSLHNISFGVGFSPFALGEKISLEDEKNLETKMSILKNLDIDLIGVFFDDMPITPNLAQIQIAAIQCIQKFFKNKIIFCPSFYSHDPILEKVFGDRPINYFEDISRGIPSDVNIAWTGPKVISQEIPMEHILDVQRLLKHKPFIWDNLFANDGPRNCNFLKLKPYSGRSAELLSETEGFAFNMMNQAELSKITFLASKLVLSGEANSEDAFKQAVALLCSEPFQNFINENRLNLFGRGLDQFSNEEKNSYLDQLRIFPDPAAQEIIVWLEGGYKVGSECLTD